MKRTLTLTGLILAFTLSMASYAAPRVKVETSLGEFVVELNQEKAPKTVANFLLYVNSGFYENTIFHRVIDGFMIQGGGFTQDYKRKMPEAPVMNEADNGLKNTRGSISMARLSDPHSATAQFFINVKNNSNLDHTNKTPRGWGYTVFGHVIKGMSTVDKIRKVKTGPGGPFRSDAPREQVIINKITLIESPVAK
jgi:cyclophilin family peptidyl-prolyl cis-trans isomerase